MAAVSHENVLLIESTDENFIAVNAEATEKDDTDILESMGYKQELNRGLGSFMNFAFGFTEVSVLCSISATYEYVGNIYLAEHIYVN